MTIKYYDLLCSRYNDSDHKLCSLSAETGLAESTISKTIHGKTGNPNVYKIVLVAKALGFDYQDIFYITRLAGFELNLSSRADYVLIHDLIKNHLSESVYDWNTRLIDAGFNNYATDL